MSRNDSSYIILNQESITYFFCLSILNYWRSRNASINHWLIILILKTHCVFFTWKMHLSVNIFRLSFQRKINIMVDRATLLKNIWEPLPLFLECRDILLNSSICFADSDYSNLKLHIVMKTCIPVTASKCNESLFKVSILMLFKVICLKLY